MSKCPTCDGFHWVTFDINTKTIKSAGIDFDKLKNTGNLGPPNASPCPTCRPDKKESIND
jgi:hypothetical protein